MSVEFKKPRFERAILKSWTEIRLSLFVFSSTWAIVQDYIVTVTRKTEL
jgi:hypothetical protein